MKITLGRKFLGCVVASILMTGVFILVMYKVPEAVVPKVLLLYFTLSVTVWFAYIGGNVWSKWVRAKNFHAEILNSKEK